MALPESRRKREDYLDSLGGKLFQLLLIALCLLLCVVGIILPVLPGLLFLALACVAAARLSPRVESWMRRNRSLAGYLKSSRGFSRLSTGGKCRYFFWMTLKVLWDSTAFTLRVIGRAAGWVRGQFLAS